MTQPAAICVLQLITSSFGSLFHTQSSAVGTIASEFVRHESKMLGLSKAEPRQIQYLSGGQSHMSFFQAVPYNDTSSHGKSNFICHCDGAGLGTRR